MPFSVSCEYNGIPIWKNRLTYPTCIDCGVVLEPSCNIEFSSCSQPTVNADISATPDGFFIVSERFVAIYEREQMIGLRFHRLENGYYALQCLRAVAYDLERFRLKRDGYCETCGRFRVQLVGPDPIRLATDESTIGNKEFVRSELSFGSPSLKQVDLLIGDEAHDVICESELKGFYFTQISH